MISALKSALKTRRARRRARLAEWRAGWASDLNAPGARKAARFDMIWLDHGIVRIPWKNRYQIAPGIWRSNQPSPEDVAVLAGMGIRSILNFRGRNQWGSFLLEEEACTEHGIILINGRLYSNRAPEQDEILAALALIEEAEKPLLMHCKSGADRAGLASVLYLLDQGNPPQEVARQLSLKHAHFPISRTGILDAFVRDYAKAWRNNGIGFRDWLDTVYDPAALSAAFEQTRRGNRLLDWVLRRE